MRDVLRVVFGLSWLYLVFGVAPTLALIFGARFWLLWALLVPVVSAVIALAWGVGKSFED